MTAHRLSLVVSSIALLSTGMASAATIKHESYRGKDGSLEIIQIDGTIEARDVEAFRQISLRLPKAVVVLNSNGGKLFPALEIGKIIKISAYTTLVTKDSVCASSCALIWVAGYRRLLSPKGHVGFHASYYDNNGKLEESGVANALIGNYLTLLDLREKAIAFATSAPPDKILWLTNANRQTAGIDFEDFTLQDAPASPSVPIPPVVVPSTIQIAPVVPKSPAPAPVSIDSDCRDPTVKDSWKVESSKNGFTRLTCTTSSGDLYENFLSDGKQALGPLRVEWLHFEDSPTIRADGFGESRYYYNKYTAIFSGKNIKVWTKSDDSENKYIKYNSSKSLLEIDCHSRKIRTLVWITYKRDGTEINRYSYGDSFTDNPMEYVTPGTVDETLFSTMCNR